ncbi:MAG TPA: hypothetical protein VKP65_00155, partial [Rhodothermales bacterium]|nr:hypothetical protein [Rhodothermales bacterium]
LQLDSKAPKIPFRDYAYNENRYRMLTQTNPEAAKRFLKQAQQNIEEHWKKYEQMASVSTGDGAVQEAAPAPRAAKLPPDGKPAPAKSGIRPVGRGKLPPGYTPKE